MKLTVGLQQIAARDVEKGISKKILSANTADKITDKKAREKAIGLASDPIYFTNGGRNMVFNPDIRYRNTFAFSPLTNINYRNDLLVFAENNEVKKAVGIIANEIAIMDSEEHKYPVFPKLKLTQITQDKQKVAGAIQDYLDNVFYPKMYQMFNFKDDGLIKKIKEFITCGKIAFEIIYDDLKNPKDISDIIPIDPSSLQKVKQNDYVFYIQKSLLDNSKERIMHENQIILIEYNEYDFGYISYVDKLRMSFNVMRSMMTSKVLWFATKSQVRMHIKFNLGDMSRQEALQKMSEGMGNFSNKIKLSDTGTVMFNNEPNNTGYQEIFTAETVQSGAPEIEEINSNGPDLTEVDSLQYWEKLFWKDTEIPYDRIDPASSDVWGFNDVASLRKIEINFAKMINSFRKLLNDIFIKPIIIQLTLKEIEIGVDLSLLDSIKMEWVAFNQYEQLAEMEVLAKRVEIATQIVEFGKRENAAGKEITLIPISWASETYLKYTKEQKESMRISRETENLELGFNADGSEKEVVEETVDEEINPDENISSDEENLDEFNADEETVDEEIDPDENISSDEETE